MKKILALVLASLLALTALSVLAEGPPSKTVDDLLVVEVVNTDAVDVIVDETENEVVDDFLEALQAKVEENTSIAEALPEAAIAALPEDAAITSVIEVVPLKVEKSTEEIEVETVIVNMKLATEFTGKTFFVLLGIVAPDGIDDWKLAPATALEDGSVNVELDKETLNWLGNNEFLAMFLE